MGLKAIFKIDGTDFTGKLKKSGIKWSRNDLDAEGSGRTLDGIMHRTRVAFKVKLEISMNTMTTEEMMSLNSSLSPQFINVEYLDPALGVTTKTFYGSSVSATTQKIINGNTYWTDTSFSIVEK